jgi:hypothetical protein
MRQVAPDPELLAGLVGRLEYKDGWTFGLADIDRGQGSEGLTLIINIRAQDSYDRNRKVSVNHYMPVPPAAFDARSWQRWLFDQVGLVEQHERCEFFRLHETPASKNLARPYAPSHGPGSDPYLIREIGTQDDVRTSFRGVRDDDGTGKPRSDL